MATETTKKKQNKKTPLQKAAAKNTAKTRATTADTAAKVTATTQAGKGKSPKAPATAEGLWHRWSNWLALLYFVQGLAIVTLGTKLSAPLTMPYPAVDTLASEANGHQIIGAASRHLFDARLAWVVAIFLVIFAAVRFVAAGMLRRQDGDQARGVSSVTALRWGGFGVGGGLMVVAIALLSGMYEITTLGMLFVSVVMAALLALGADIVITANRGTKNSFAHLLCTLATIAIVLPWLVFAAGVVGALVWHGHISGYMYSIYVCTALLFGAIFLATHFRFTRRGKWADGLYAERSFMALEFITASLLAWQVFAGVLR